MVAWSAGLRDWKQEPILPEVKIWDAPAAFLAFGDQMRPVENVTQVHYLAVWGRPPSNLVIAPLHWWASSSISLQSIVPPHIGHIILLPLVLKGVKHQHLEAPTSKQVTQVLQEAKLQFVLALADMPFMWAPS